MSLHQADITARVRRFLDRRQMPRRLEDKPQAQQDEIAALVACVGRYAPRDNLAEWWTKFETKLGECGAGSLWPTEKEIRECAAFLRPERPKAALQEASREDGYAIVGKRMAAGEAVGEEYLWGRQAVEIIKRKLVDRDTMQRYRSAAFLARKRAYGEAAALAWEADMKDRHQVAIDVLSAPASQRVVDIPDKAEKPAWAQQ